MIKKTVELLNLLCKSFDNFLISQKLKVNEKLIFNFKSKNLKNLKKPKNVLGGKGANLAEMGRLGMPVPPGFTISTDVCFILQKKKIEP